jgi:hypothetical protein
MAGMRKDANGNINGLNKQCGDSSLILFTVTPADGYHDYCNALCIDLKDCVNYSMYNGRCSFWKGVCPTEQNKPGSNIYALTWSSKPDLTADKCTHLEQHSSNHNMVFDCRYKNKKDCADMTLN